MDVDVIVEKSTKSRGIRKDGPEFKAQLEHARRYAAISDVKGSIDGEQTELSVMDNIPEISIGVETEDLPAFVGSMIRAVGRMRERLRRQGPDPL